MLFRSAVIAATVSALSGCASVLEDKTQPVKVETLDQAGSNIVGAKCDLQNDRGTFHVETPNTVFVRKSSGELVITCNAPAHHQADAKLISRVGGAVFGNILLGGGIGAIIDTASGVAFNYPEWVQLVFGKSLTFDRNDFEAAQPTIAKATVDDQPQTQTADAQRLDAPQPAPESEAVQPISISAADTDSAASE